MDRLLQQLQSAIARNDSAAVAELHRKIAMRMARVCVPEHQIAFILGLNLKLLRATYGDAMKHAAAAAHAIFQDTLFHLANIRKNASAILLWAKLQNKNSTNNKKEKPTYPDRIPPGAILFVGPDGELL